MLLRSGLVSKRSRSSRADPNTPTTVIGLRDRAARATVNATREAERNLCAEAAKRGSPAARAGGLCRPEPDSAFAPIPSAEGDAGHRFVRDISPTRDRARAQLGEVRVYRAARMRRLRNHPR